VFYANPLAKKADFPPSLGSLALRRTRLGGRGRPGLANLAGLDGELSERLTGEPRTVLTPKSQLRVASRQLPSRSLP